MHTVLLLVVYALLLPGQHNPQVIHRLYPMPSWEQCVSLMDAPPRLEVHGSSLVAKLHCYEIQGDSVVRTDSAQVFTP